MLALIFIREGPLRSPSPRFNLRFIKESFNQRDLVLVNLGYLGHMWELFAMWTWIVVFLIASFERAGINQQYASMSTFIVNTLGGLGSLIAGKLADQNGRTTITIVSLIISGTCALVVGHFYGENPFLVLGICLLWGFAIVANSAQYSASISELCNKEFTGTALTLQTSLGFLLTLVSIRAIPPLVNRVGWEWVFSFLALGPVVGIWAMIRLRGSPSADKLADRRK